MIATKRSIVIVENHAIVRAGVEFIVASMPEFVLTGSASDGMEGLKLILEKNPEIAIVDLSLPSLSGISIVKELRRSESTVKTIVLTRHHYLPYLMTLLKLGISAYVLKDNAADELKIALMRVVAGKSYVSPAIEEMKEKFEKPGPGEDIGKASVDALTNREKEILKLIGEGYKNQEIANMLNISINTVKVHRNHLIQKLGASGTSELVKMSLKAGLGEI